MLRSREKGWNLPFATTWVDLEISILSEVHHRKRQISRDITYMWNLENSRSELIYNELNVSCRYREGWGRWRDHYGVWDGQIETVHPKGNQSWIFTGRTDDEAEALILWSDAKSWLTGKDPDAGKDWGQEEKETTEDEMVGGHVQLNGHEFEQIPGDSEGQGSLACCSPWGYKELGRIDTT